MKRIMDIKQISSLVFTFVFVAQTTILGYSSVVSAYAIDSIKTTAGNLGNTVKETTENAAKTTKEAAGELGKTAIETGEKASKTAKDAAEKASRAAQEAGEKASQKAKDITETATKKATEAGKAASEGAKNAYNATSSVASSTIKNVKQYVANIDTEKFKSGWDYAAKYTGVAIASLKGKAYVDAVEKTIKATSETMQKELSGKVVSGRTIQQDAGFAAEIWHTDTFNLEAALNGSEYNATRPDLNTKASADVTINGKNGYSQDYSLKYYKDAESSAKAQAKTFYEDYRHKVAEDQRHGKTPMTAEEYLNQYDKPLDSLYDSLYAGQKKLIPADQLEGAKAYLKAKKAKMSTSEIVERQKFSPELQESLDTLAARIEAPDGTKSKPLTEKLAKELVELTRDNKELNLADFGITPSQLITPRYILKQSINAGTQAAVISTAFAIGPDVYKIVVDAAKDGRIDEKKLKETGIEGVLAGSEGFVEGSVSSAIVIACQSGKFGAAYTNIAPETVGTLTVLTIDAIRYGYQLSSGQITKADYANLMTQNIIIAISSQTSGALLQVLFPYIPFAYVAGSMAGAMLASAGYEAGKEMYLEVKGEDGFETVVASNVKDGTTIATDLLKSVNIKDGVSSLKNIAVTTFNNGKIKILNWG